MRLFSAETVLFLTPFHIEKIFKIELQLNFLQVYILSWSQEERILYVIFQVTTFLSVACKEQHNKYCDAPVLAELWQSSQCNCHSTDTGHIIVTAMLVRIGRRGRGGRNSFRNTHTQEHLQVWILLLWTTSQFFIYIGNKWNSTFSIIVLFLLLCPRHERYCSGACQSYKRKE